MFLVLAPTNLGATTSSSRPVLGGESPSNLRQVLLIMFKEFFYFFIPNTFQIFYYKIFNIYQDFYIFSYSNINYRFRINFIISKYLTNSRLDGSLFLSQLDHWISLGRCTSKFSFKIHTSPLTIFKIDESCLMIVIPHSTFYHNRALACQFTTMARHRSNIFLELARLNRFDW